MVQPPHPPPGPGTPPPFESGNQEYWQGYSQSPYAARPKRGVTPLAAVGIALGCGVAAFGAYLVFGSPGGPSAGAISSEAEKALEAVTCPNPGGVVEAQVLVSAQQLDVFTSEMSPATGRCLTAALDTMKLGGVDPSALVQATLPIGFDAQGKPSLAGPARAHRLEANWELGVVGDDLSAKRSRLQTILEAGSPDVTACYADGAIRGIGQLPDRSWHTKDEVQVRLRIEPSGAIAGIEVKRPGVVYVADWASSAGFIGCVRSAMHTLNWPGHGGATWNWVNTTLEINQVAL